MAPRRSICVVCLLVVLSFRCLPLRYFTQGLKQIFAPLVTVDLRKDFCLDFDVFLPNTLTGFHEAPILQLGNIYLKQKSPSVLFLESLGGSFHCVDGRLNCEDGQLTHFNTRWLQWALWKCSNRPGCKVVSFDGRVARLCSSTISNELDATDPIWTSCVMPSNSSLPFQSVLGSSGIRAGQWEAVSIHYDASCHTAQLFLAGFLSSPVFLSTSAKTLSLKFYSKALWRDAYFTGYVRNVRVRSQIDARSIAGQQLPALRMTTLVFICDDGPNRIPPLLEVSGCKDCHQAVYTLGCRSNNFPLFQGVESIETPIIAFVDGTIWAPQDWLLQAMHALDPSLYADQAVLVQRNGTIASSGYNKTVIGMVDFNRGWPLPSVDTLSADYLDCTVTVFNVSKVNLSKLAARWLDRPCHSLSALGSGPLRVSLRRQTRVSDGLSTSPAVLLDVIPHRPKVLLSTSCGDVQAAAMVKEGLKQGTPFAVRYVRGGLFCDATMLDYLPQVERELLDSARHLDFGHAGITILPAHIRHLWGQRNTSGSYVAVASSSYIDLAEQDYLISSDMVLMHSTEEQDTLSSLHVIPRNRTIIPLPILPLPWQAHMASLHNKINFLMYVCKSETTCDRMEWLPVLIAFMKEFSPYEGVGLYITGEGRTRSELLTHLQGATSTFTEGAGFGSHAKRFGHITVLAPGDFAAPFTIVSSVDYVLASCTNSRSLAQLALSLGTPVIPLFQIGLTGCMSKPVIGWLLHKELLHLPCSADKRTPAIRMVLRQHAEAVSMWSPDVRLSLQSDAQRLCSVTAAVKHLHELADRPPLQRNKLLQSHFIGPMGSQQTCSVAQRGSLRNKLSSKKPFKIAMVTTWLPTRCGIATFGGNMACSLAASGNRLDIFRLVPDDTAVAEALNLTGNTCNNAVRVRNHILQSNFPEYLQAAAVINSNAYDVVILQYEFGIWGGECGAYALCFLAALHVPSLLVLHTADDGLSNCHHSNLFTSLQLAAVSVVMSARTQGNLRAYHGFAALNTSFVIPHGVPSVKYRTPLDGKATFPELQGRFVLMTNGLINPGKGLHIAIEAVAMLSSIPVTYVIVGEPHPTCAECKAYYAKLQSMVHALGIDDRVLFMTKFLSQGMLVEVLQATDIFVLPYLGLTTSNSGTLSMALAVGKCIVATPFEHALAVCEGRCKLVGAGDPSALAHALAHLHHNSGACLNMSAAAYAYGSTITWSKVAGMYEELIASIV